MFPLSLLRLSQSLVALFASSLAISVVFAIIPLCHNVVVLAVVMAVAGLAMGCIDTISNMQLVKIYQKDSAIFLQVRQMRWLPLGAVLSGRGSSCCISVVGSRSFRKRLQQLPCRGEQKINLLAFVLSSRPFTSLWGSGPC